MHPPSALTRPQLHPAPPATLQLNRIEQALKPWNSLATRSFYLVRRPDLTFAPGYLPDETIPCFIFLGPRGGGEPLRLGLFAGIHGDEPAGTGALFRFIERLDRHPELACGLTLFIYPICNPTGFQDTSRHSRRGKDLNREFWIGSAEPEVQLLERELRSRRFHGIISLHSDDTSEGVYGFVNGATLTRHLLLPALEAAARFLPPNKNGVIDGFTAREGMIHGGYPGMLRAQPGAAPAPFELVLESPQRAAASLQEQALAAALESIVIEYPRLLAFAADL